MRTLLLLAFTVISAFAAEQKHYLREFAPFKSMSGPRLTAALQKDKGAVYIFWLYVFEKSRNGEALKSFQKIAEEYKDTLVMVGIENSPNSSMKPVTPKEIAALTKSAGVTFSIYSGCKAPVEINSYPSIFIFDREGHMLHGGIFPEPDVLEILLKKAAAPVEKKDGKADSKKDGKEAPKTDPKKAA